MRDRQLEDADPGGVLANAPSKIVFESNKIGLWREVDRLRQEIDQLAVKIFEERACLPKKKGVE